MKDKSLHKVVTKAQHKKAVKIGWSKLMELILELTVENVQKAKKYIIELLEGQK